MGTYIYIIIHVHTYVSIFLKHISGNDVFGCFQGFLGSDVDKQLRESTWNLPGPSYPAPILRFQKENRKNSQRNNQHMQNRFYCQEVRANKWLAQVSWNFPD